MACFISFRDISFWPSTEGVRVIVTTDVPSHIWVRVTSVKPRIHKKTSIIRGLPLLDDVRFCFDVFDDFEQTEDGDTLEHTFWLKDWPVCTVKWLYLWGSRAGVVCVSTSVPFHYHNDGVSPVTPPRVLRAFTTVEPNLVSYGTPNSWWTYDLKGFVDENASGILLHWRHTSGALWSIINARMKGAGGYHGGISRLGGQSWLICGLDADKQFELRTSVVNTGEFWLMGYFNQNAHFLDLAIERVPTPAGWTTIDWSDVLPANAIAGIFHVGNTSSTVDEYGVRPVGSTRDTRVLGIFNTAIIKLNGIQVDYGKLSAGVEGRFRNSCIGYLTAGYTGETEGIELAVPADATWRDITCVQHYPHPQLLIIEWAAAAALNTMGARKWESNHSYSETGVGHSWPSVHPHDPGKAQLHRMVADDHYYLMGSLD